MVGLGVVRRAADVRGEYDLGQVSQLGLRIEPLVLEVVEPGAAEVPEDVGWYNATTVPAPRAPAASATAR